MNSITLIGRLGADPEIKYFQSGTNVAKFSIAVDRPQRNGEKVTDWFACECWSKTAETVANYCQKGKQVAILGRIEFDYWQDKNTGEKRSKAVVKVERIELLGSNNGGTGGDSLQQVEQMPHHTSQPVSAAALSDDDNIPF